MGYLFFGLLSIVGSGILGYIIGTVFARYSMGIVLTMVASGAAGLCFSLWLFAIMKSAGAFV